MTINRKDFIKKTCLTGICVCGINSVTAGQSGSGTGVTPGILADNPNALQQAWVSALLDGMDNILKEDELRSMLKPCALTHYNNLGMDEVLKDYIGDIDKWINFLVTEWNWKVDYDRNAGQVICDENKGYCVCPMVNKTTGIASTSICYCSEGFIEKMFSVITGRDVKGRVESSILRGDKSCRYVVYL